MTKKEAFEILEMDTHFMGSNIPRYLVANKHNGYDYMTMLMEQDSKLLPFEYSDIYVNEAIKLVEYHNNNNTRLNTMLFGSDIYED